MHPLAFVGQLTRGRPDSNNRTLKSRIAAEGPGYLRPPGDFPGGQGGPGEAATVQFLPQV